MKLHCSQPRALRRFWTRGGFIARVRKVALPESPRAEGCEAVLFNGRQYDVPHGAFPEFEQARALRRELEAESDAPRSLQEVGDLAEMDEVVQRVISRAMEAMRIVESDLESKLIHFR